MILDTNIFFILICKLICRFFNLFLEFKSNFKNLRTWKWKKWLIVFHFVKEIFVEANSLLSVFTDAWVGLIGFYTNTALRSFSLFWNICENLKLKVNYVLFLRNFYPIASNRPPSIIFLLASSYSLDSFFSSSTTFFYTTLSIFFLIWETALFFDRSYFFSSDFFVEFILISYLFSLAA